MSPVDAPHTKYEICLLMTILWFALIFMLNFLCLGDTGDSAHRLLKNDEHMHARYYFVVIVFLFIHYLICVQRRINTVFGEIEMTTQRDASRTPEMANYERVIGELKNRHQWARFVSRTLAEDRARFDEIAYLKNEVQLLKRKLKCSWTRGEVLNEKMRQCEASGAFVLFHSLNASAFARESDADELDLELPVLRTRSTPV